MSSSKSGFSLTDLQQGAKRLHTVQSPSDSKLHDEKEQLSVDNIEALDGLGKTFHKFKSAQ